MSYRIKIAIPAREDAHTYAAYIRNEHQSVQAAKQWLDGLYLAIKGLEETPNRFPVIAEAEELGFPYRAQIYHSHRIVYAVDDTTNCVIVHRIYHGARLPLTKKEL